jgi:hypothetical protein
VKLRPPLLMPLAAALVTASAIYFSLGVLDQLAITGAMVRLAYLPHWSVLLGSAVVAALVLAALRPAMAALPLLALIVLAIPYLPVLPDRWPVLQVLAGPLAWVVWLVVIGVQGWVIWQGRTGTGLLRRLSPRQALVGVFGVTALLSGLVAWRLVATPAFPGGDEPHYLVIAQSVWRDGDLDIRNNHQRGDYYEYSPQALEPHYLKAGTDGGIYSVHPILMPVLMAPVYAAGGYPGVVVMLILIASAAAALAWRWVRDLLNATGAATFAWVAIAASSPYLLNTFTVYPETCAALAVMTALVLAITTPQDRPGVRRHVAIGIACGVLPWLSTKYAPMSAALMAVAYGRLWRLDARTLVREPKAWAVSVPYAVSLLAWFTFFYAYWGTPMPNAPYGDHGQTSPLHLLRGAPGLLLDQEYGLLAFAPVYVLAATGLVAMMRLGGELRRQAMEIMLIFAALLGTVGAFALWWGGSAAPARPIVSGLLLLMLPIAVAFREAPPRSARRAAQHLLLWVGVGIAITLTVAQNGLLVDNGRDGTAALLDYWSPRWALWSLAPTFTFHDPPLAYLHSAWWLVIAGAASAVLFRHRSRQPGVSALVALAVFSGALLVAGLTMPLLPAGPSRPPIDLAARTRLASLDGFDLGLRPIAARYDGVRTVDPVETLPHATLSVTPGLRTDRTPLPLIHNGRFSLPAGTYTVEVTFAGEVPSGQAALGLQVGRLGRPFHSWEVQPRAGATWRTTFTLPVDANFIGFRGQPELEAAIQKIAITPTRVVDVRARARGPAVLSAAAYPEASFFFHNEQAHPEPRGMWTVGRRSVVVTVAPAPGGTDPVVLRMHSGRQANTVTMSADGWRWQQDLVPGQVAEVQLPSAVRGVVLLTLTTSAGFVPRDFDPAIRDSRFLGVWLELKRREPPAAGPD